MNMIERPIGMKTLTVQLADDVADKLSSLADIRGVTVENLVTAGAEALADDLRDGDDARQHHQWTAEDLAAINDGLAQLGRGESVSQEEVEAHIDAVLRG
jgi:predicted transcriptional regulator